MHELSIAMNIVDIADEETKKANANKVYEIELEIGTMSGIVLEALEFALQEAVKDSVLGNAKIKITEIQAKAKCLNCLHIFKIEDLYSPCPNCNEFKTEIISGKELRVKSLKVE